MNNSRKPYIKNITRGEHVIIFNGNTNMFIEHVINECKKYSITPLITLTKTGRLKLRISCNNPTISKLKQYVKDEYEEFHHYNKEVHRAIKNKWI